MTIRYVGPGGNDGNSGLSWALRKLTLNGAEDTPVVAGDVVYVGPGVYRESLTCDVSGANTYSTGTVSVTKGSDQVTGSGTAWLANVAADYLFHVRLYASGTDGVTDGTSTFTSAAGNFQANMVGCPIQINTKQSYIIATYVSATEITLSYPHDPVPVWPAADTGLTYSVMSGEGHYDIESVDADGTITLKQPWQGKTLTGLAYLTFNPITYIGDVTGEHTDGIGGVVRITGSDNDQTTTRDYCIFADTKNYRVFRGFRVDAATVSTIYLTSCQHCVIEDCVSLDAPAYGIQISGASQLCCTVRRVISWGGITGHPIAISHTSTLNDAGNVVESAIVLGGLYISGVLNSRVGGITVRNILSVLSNYGARVATALNVGQCMYITNSIMLRTDVGLRAATLGEIIENYNCFSNCSTNRTNVGIGANSVSYIMAMTHPVLCDGFKFPWWFGELSEWSQIKRITGVDERNTDMFGTPRPVTAAKNSWGPFQFVDMELEATTVQAGLYARVLNDAGAQMVRRVPCTNVQTTVTLYVRRETNYAGSMPRMVIKQPGQADRTTDMTAAVDTYEQLSDTFTPAALPGYFEVWCQSRNTAVAGDYKVFYDTLAVN